MLSTETSQVMKTKCDIDIVCTILCFALSLKHVTILNPSQVIHQTKASI